MRDEINGGGLVARTLKTEKIKGVFGLIGYHVSPIFAGCAKEGIEIIGTRHEQASVHMAEAFAQTSGQLGVAISIGGPGFTNSFSAIIKAYMSQVPVLIITGAADHYKNDQNGAQDLDQLAMIRPYTKWCGLVNDVNRIPEYICKAIKYAVSGRKGPAVVEIPINFLKEKTSFDKVEWPINYKFNGNVLGDPSIVKNILNLITESKKPLLVIGNEAFYDNDPSQVKEFVERLDLPFLTLDSSRGLIPDNHELCQGNGRVLEAGPQLYAYENADCILFLGCSIDYTLFQAKSPIFAKNKKVIQVNLDPNEISNHSQPVDLPVVGNVCSIISQLNHLLKSELSSVNYSALSWVKELKENSSRFFTDLIQQYSNVTEGLNPVEVLDIINNASPKDSITIMDGSNAMLWASLMLKSYKPGHLIVGPNGRYGPMGTGLPAAIGAKLAYPDSPVILYTGDGSLGFNIMEMATAIQYNLPLLIVVHNDSSWGFCKETQSNIFPNEDCSFGTDLGNIDYSEVCKSFGGDGSTVKTLDEFEKAFKMGIKSKSIYCINAIMDKNAMSPGAILMNTWVSK